MINANMKKKKNMTMCQIWGKIELQWCYIQFLIFSHVLQSAGGWTDEVQYVMTSHNQRCHRDPGRNVICNYLPFLWSSGEGKGSGGKKVSGWDGGSRGRISCPTGFSHFVDTCIEVTLLTSLPTAASWSSATATCDPLNSVVFQPRSWVVWEAVKIFLTEKGASGNFWVGNWTDVEANMIVTETIDWAEGGKDVSGDCVLASMSDFKWTRASCDESSLFLCEQKKEETSDCRSGFTKLEGKHPSCVKLTSDISASKGSKKYASISTANKMCIAEGASLAAPETSADRSTLAQWVTDQSIPLTGVVSHVSPFRAFIGLRYYKKTGTHAEESYSSPWEEKIPATNGSLRAALTSTWDKPCMYLKNDAATDNAIPSPCLDEFSANSETRAVCETRSCEPTADTKCVFPFKVAGRTYDKCTKVANPSGTETGPWCSLKVTEEGVHEVDEEKECPDTCSSTICPIGFWPHLGTCIQESSSDLSDIVATVEEAENRCLDQGARLYQPRSTRSLQTLYKRTPAFFDPHYNHNISTITTILPFVTSQQTILGIEARSDGTAVTLWYRDGSQVSPGLVGDPQGLKWTASGPDLDPAKTAVNFVAPGLIGNALPDVGQNSLSYICEARPFTTLDGDDPGKPCHFPFKLAKNSSWLHSCVYDKDVRGVDKIWCPTQVDVDGVVVPGKTGTCDDERNTAYAGPGLNS